MKSLIILFLSLLLIVLPNCVHLEIKKAGVLEGASRTNENCPIKIPTGVYPENIPPVTYPPDRARKKIFDPGDGSEINFYHLGRCGSQLSFTGIMIPIIPFWLPNSCKTDGFYISTKWNLDTFGINLQLHYNNTTYDSYVDNGSIKFRIENFSEFKKAKDKTLIIHKKKPDGTIWTKEIPFDWKTVIEISGGL